MQSPEGSDITQGKGRFFQLPPGVLLFVYLWREGPPRERGVREKGVFGEGRTISVFERSGVGWVLDMGALYI